MSGAARSAPSVERNREPILDVLRDRLPSAATILEVASGTGEHALFFASAMPDVTWQPTDRDPDALASIAAWRDTAGPTNMLPPLFLDAADPATWPDTAPDAVVAINMVHIAPWTATQGLVAGAARVLQPGGLLFLYGPFREAGTHIGSNAAFDADLRARNQDWGVRDLEDVAAEAARHGLVLEEQVEMPANNRTLVFVRG